MVKNPDVFLYIVRKTDFIIFWLDSNRKVYRSTLNFNIFHPLVSHFGFHLASID
jgi:hypothetical protein